MALNYLLNQVEPLDAFLVGMIKYFEIETVGGKAPSPSTLSSFFPAISFVENWLK